MYKGNITLITTIWKRRKYLAEFLERWLAQPQIDEIIIWDNSGEYRPEVLDKKIKLINSSYNFPVAIRDVMSHFAKNDVVMVSDDDVMIEEGFVADMAQYYEPDRYLGIWGNNFKGSYENRNIIVSNRISEPVEVDAMVGLIYMIDRKYLLAIDHRDLMWTCYDINLSGIFKTRFPELKKLVVPNKLWHQTEEETDEFALCKHSDASKEKQELYERYWK